MHGRSSDPLTGDSEEANQAGSAADPDTGDREVREPTKQADSNMGGGKQQADSNMKEGEATKETDSRMEGGGGDERGEIGE